MLITSTKNPKIKQLLELQQKSAERRRTGLFVVEGQRELEHCLAAGYEVESVFVNEELRMKNEELVLPQGLEADGGASPSYFTLAPHVYERIAYRGSTEGVVAIIKSPERGASSLQQILKGSTNDDGLENALFIILESVEKPGNLGAVLRSADAAGATDCCVFFCVVGAGLGADLSPPSSSSYAREASRLVSPLEGAPNARPTMQPKRIMYFAILRIFLPSFKHHATPNRPDKTMSGIALAFYR